VLPKKSYWSQLIPVDSGSFRLTGNRPLWNATPAHPHVRRTSFRQQSNLCPASANQAQSNEVCPKQPVITKPVPQNPRGATRNKIHVLRNNRPKSHMPPPFHKKPVILKRNIQPPSRPSNFVTDLRLSSVQPPPTRLNPIKIFKATRLKKVRPQKSPFQKSHAPSIQQSNRPPRNATSAHTHSDLCQTSVKPPPTRLSAIKSFQSNPS
jgi:hypothetical protein